MNKYGMKAEAPALLADSVDHWLRLNPFLIRATF